MKEFTELEEIGDAANYYEETTNDKVYPVMSRDEDTVAYDFEQGAKWYRDKDLPKDLNWFEKLPLHWKLASPLLVGIYIGLSLAKIFWT